MRSASEDLTSLEERFGPLLAVRATLAGVIAALAVAAPPVLADRPGAAVALAGAYVALAVAVEVEGRRWPALRVPLHRAFVPLDVAFLVTNILPAGGAVRAAALLLAIEVVAVTLLASRRSGARVALWGTIALFAARQPWIAEQVRRLRPGPHVAPAPLAATVLAATCLWLLAGGTAWWSSIDGRELRRVKTELAALTSMAVELETAAGAPDVLGGLARAVSAALPVDRVVAVWDDGAEVMGWEQGRDGEVAELATDRLAGGVREDPDLARAWASRSPQLLARCRPERNDALARLLPDAQGIVLLPLGPDGEQRGVLAVVLGRRAAASGRLPRRRVDALAQFASHATLVLRNTRLSAERERLARIDGLTALANRRAFDETLAAEVNRANRSGQPLSLVLLDIDNFKQINDRRGHQAGDDVLRRLGALLSRAVRSGDVAARYGGEEFALVLPACGAEGAVRVAEAARRATAGASGLDGVTLSAGVASLPAHVADGDALVRAADAALYRSKRNGRDRVTVYSPGTEALLDLRETRQAPA